MLFSSCISALSRNKIPPLCKVEYLEIEAIFSPKFDTQPPENYSI
jgi:hypothetical protein